MTLFVSFSTLPPIFVENVCRHTQCFHTWVLGRLSASRCVPCLYLILKLTRIDVILILIHRTLIFLHPFLRILRRSLPNLQNTSSISLISTTPSVSRVQSPCQGILLRTGISALLRHPSSSRTRRVMTFLWNCCSKRPMVPRRTSVGRRRIPTRTVRGPYNYWRRRKRVHDSQPFEIQTYRWSRRFIEISIGFGHTIFENDVLTVNSNSKSRDSMRKTPGPILFEPVRFRKWSLCHAYAQLTKGDHLL